MKYLYLSLLLLLFTIEASSQTLADSSGLTVLEKKWRVNSAMSSNPVGEDPFQSNNEANQKVRDQKDNNQQNRIRQQAGLPSLAPPVRFRVDNRGRTTDDLVLYTYKIKVRNNGAKTIKQVVWEYVFIDSTTNQEAGRHQFTSLIKLKPREVDELIMIQLSSPIDSVNAKDAGKKFSELYTEQIIIKSVQYADDTVWHADSK